MTHQRHDQMKTTKTERTLRQASASQQIILNSFTSSRVESRLSNSYIEANKELKKQSKLNSNQHLLIQIKNKQIIGTKQEQFLEK